MNPVGRVTALLVALLVALLMAACAAVPQAPIAGVTLSGRLAVHVDGVDGGAARSMSAAFELRGDPQSGHLNLSTPLGSVVAQARWSPGTVVLVTPQGEKNFPDLDALTRDVLGESLPVAALFDWLQGRPWPGAASTATVAPAEPGFEQLGWLVSVARFDDALIAAQRERPPVVTLRAKLDRP